MANFALWGLLITSVLGGFCSIVVMSHKSPEMDVALKESMLRRGAPIRRAAFIIIVLGLVNAAFWTLLAIGSDWRYAAIWWIPFAAGWLGRANSRKS